MIKIVIEADHNLEIPFVDDLAWVVNRTGLR